MKIMTEHTAIAADYIGRAIGKDPLSWDRWTLLRVEIQHAGVEMFLYPMRALQDTVKERCKDGNGLALFLDDGDIVLLAKHMTQADMQNLGNALAMVFFGTPFEPAKIDMLDISQAWGEAVRVCQQTAQRNGASEDDGAFTLAPSHSEEFLEHDISMLESCLQNILKEDLKKRRFMSPACVLLVEDDDLTRRLASNALKKDYRLVTAATAEDAISAYLLHAPDIVFLDINLPDHNGFTVLNSILRCDKDAYVVMFSGNGYADNLVDALTHGAQGFVTKPFRKELLSHYIRECDAVRQARPCNA